MHPAALDGSLQLGFCASSNGGGGGSGGGASSSTSSKGLALVPVGARLYEAPSQLSTRSGAAMITSVSQCGASSSSEAGVETESCHSLAFTSAGGV